jgi:hypothetical protein
MSMFHVFGITLFLLCGVHFLCDFPLQGQYLSDTKNPWGKNNAHWPISMLAHVTIHGLGVFAVTGSLALVALEMLYHAFIDFTKCRGLIGFNTDQLLHLSCKVAWALFYAYLVFPKQH